MKKKLQSRIIVSCLTVAMGVLLWGCNAEESEPSVPVTESVPAPITEATSANVLSDTTPDVETRPITITVINLSNTDVGMFSIIDPLLKEQTDVGQVDAEGTLSIQCNWPIDEKELQWAVYDMQGELLLESTTDITECEKNISILLSGEITIDDVDVLFN